MRIASTEQMMKSTESTEIAPTVKTSERHCGSRSSDGRRKTKKISLVVREVAVKTKRTMKKSLPPM